MSQKKPRSYRNTIRKVAKEERENILLEFIKNTKQERLLFRIKAAWQILKGSKK